MTSSLAERIMWGERPQGVPMEWTIRLSAEAIAVYNAYPGLAAGEPPVLDGKAPGRLTAGEIIEEARGTMPLHGIEERLQPHRLGKVRLGVKKVSTKTGREYPSATDYFVIGELPEVQALYGEKPTTLPIYFLFNDVDRTFPHFLKRYGASRLQCMSDGEWVVYREMDAPDAEGELVTQHVRDGLDKAAGQPVKCAWQDCPWYGLEKGKGCRETGRLLFGIQGIARLGYYELVVHKLGVQRILGQLLLAQSICGQIVKLPFLLHLAPEEAEVPMANKAGEIVPTRKTLYLPWIEIEPDFLGQYMPRLTYNAPSPFMLEAGVPAAIASAAKVTNEDFEDLEHEQMDPEDIDEAIEGEIEQPHWIEDPEVRKRFWAWTKNTLALSEGDVHEALDVEHIAEYAGTMVEAKAQIEAWLEDKVKNPRKELEGIPF